MRRWCRSQRDCGANAIATAHCAEDQTETVLLALFRRQRARRASPACRRAGRRWGRGHRSRAPVLALYARGTACRAAAHRLAARARSDQRAAPLPAQRAAGAARRPARRLTATRCLGRALRRDPARRTFGRCKRARARNDLRERLRERDLLRDIPFERIEAALDAAPGARVFLKPGVEAVDGDIESA